MRVDTITKNVYKFDELTNESQDKALSLIAESEGEFFYSECVIDDCATIAELFGLDIRHTRKTSMDGTKTWYDPTVYYSGFWNQGDGACFKSQYEYKAGSLKAVKECAPNETEVHRIVKELQDIQRRNFYKLTATTKHSGHYYHSGCMVVNVYHTDGNDISGDTENIVTQCLRDFADWIYNKLEKEYDYVTGRENCEERATELEFLEDGTIY